MSLRTLLSSLLLSTTLLAASGCSTTGAPALRPDPASPHLARDDRSPRIDRAKLRAALAARRADNVQRFLAYRDARVYPVNTYGAGQQHVWLDSFGNLCAAATIISGDWGRDVTARVSLEDNFIALAGVAEGPLLDWILTSGLTHHEIVAIQEPGWFDDRQDAREREAEIERLFAIYTSVERQLATMQDASLDDATDALLAHPELARALLDGVAAGPGRYGDPAFAGATPGPASSPASVGFAPPPPG